VSDHTRGLSIELENLTKQYPNAPLPAVDNVSMMIPAGNMVVFVGPSGCGKTTTMKMVNRLIEPTSGVIRLGGEDVTRTDAVQLRRRIGYVIQSIGLFPHQTIFDNVAAVPRMLGWKKQQISSRVEELLDLVGLDPAFTTRYPRQLSGGQQQRVGVARALAADPPVLLMDEPFGATDPITRLRIQREFRRLQQDLGKTVIFVTHDFEEALLLGDRVAVLTSQSRIVQYDTPLALLAAPADEHVRSFVGGSAHMRMIGLLPASLAVDPSVQSNGVTVSDATTLREVTDRLVGGATSVGLVDSAGTIVGAIDFAAVQRTVADQLHKALQVHAAQQEHDNSEETNRD
jgi:osmoprotectant transport system ATP-binding protein